ncbi:MAG: amidohydrolase family protein [Chitinophagaceae bacterium]|nr:amidohydrolase family protein [Chitinophagaceae bacterium]
MRFCLLLVVMFATTLQAQKEEYILLKADRVFDGENMHEGWSVLIKNNLVEAVGIISGTPANTVIKNFPGCTIMPGLIEGHSHLLLHPYNETTWDDQVLNESRAERIARAANHAKATLMAGFTTIRDLGTEGAMYDDAGLKKAIEKGIIPGPRMIVATRAIVAKGTYGPKSQNPEVLLMQGAAEVANTDEMAKEVRIQIAAGADVIKVYADYSWGIDHEVLPTFTLEELSAAVAIAASGNRKVAAHATTVEGMRRAILAGISTIEHGDDGNAEIFSLMKEKKVALCATLAAGDANFQYGGWKKGIDPEPARITKKKNSFALALQSGVTICMGGDVGVFAHGDNAREMEMMVEYGMKPLEVLRSATSVNADVFGYGNSIGRLKKGLAADVIAVQGNPLESMKAIHSVSLVMKDGKIYSTPLVEGK